VVGSGDDTEEETQLLDVVGAHGEVIIEALVVIKVLDQIILLHHHQVGHLSNKKLKLLASIKV
jgi:hypothetical protein